MLTVKQIFSFHVNYYLSAGITQNCVCALHIVFFIVFFLRNHYGGCILTVVTYTSFKRGEYISMGTLIKYSSYIGIMTPEKLFPLITCMYSCVHLYNKQPQNNEYACSNEIYFVLLAVKPHQKSNIIETVFDHR